MHRLDENLRQVLFIVICWVLSAVLGCSLTQCHLVDGRAKPALLTPGNLNQDTLWRGVIRIQGVITVPQGVTLKLAPGTRVEFLPQDQDQDGVGDSGLYVNGRIIAQGEPNRMIEFTSGSQSVSPSQWGTIQLEYSPGSGFKYCRFTGADWAIHAHFSDLEVEHCILERNAGGMRFRSGPVKITHNLIQRNNIGLRFRSSNPVIQYNTIRQNHIGIFVRENSRPEISHNNLLDNTEYHIELEETQTQDIYGPQNWWGTGDDQSIEKLIYDKQDLAGIGRVHYEPIAAGSFPAAF